MKMVTNMTMMTVVLLGYTALTQSFVVTPVSMNGAAMTTLVHGPPVLKLRPKHASLSSQFAAGCPVASQRLIRTTQNVMQKRRTTSAVNGMEMNFVVEGVMRCVACMPYILPMMDSLAYGRFLFQKVPILAVIFMKPLQPFLDLAQAFPMISFVAFLGLFLFVVRNKAVPRFIRFNTMQALLLEILLIFPQILTSSNMGGVIPFMFTEFVSNMTFYAIATIVGYSCFSNLIGELPCKIPVISTAVFQQIGGGAGYE